MGQLLKILDYRHDEVISRNAAATRDLLAAAERERDLMKLIAQKTQQESRSMKIVAFIAMVYLPATLVAVSNAPSIYAPKLALGLSTEF